MRRSLAFALLSSVLFGFTLLQGGSFAWAWSPFNAPHYRFLLPKEFHGWAVIEYGIPNADPIEPVGQEITITIPPSGRLQTSSLFLGKYSRTHRYFRKNADQLEILNPKVFIHSASDGYLVCKGDPHEIKRQWFFVGTEREFHDNKEDICPDASK